MIVKTCPVCGENFNATYENRKYCSQNCRKQKVKENSRERYREIHGKLETKQCAHCGEAFLPKNGNQIYCSYKCKCIVANKRNRKTEGTYITPRQCKWCNTLFQGEDQEKKYCCKQCEEDALRFKESKNMLGDNFNQVAKRRKEHAKIVAAARARGVSYGVYVSQMAQKENV